MGINASLFDDLRDVGNILVRAAHWPQPVVRVCPMLRERLGFFFSIVCAFESFAKALIFMWSTTGGRLGRTSR